MDDPKDKPYRQRPLTPKERMFVNAFTDPTSPSFMHQTKAALNADPDAKQPAASGMRWAHRPIVASEIRKILAEQGFSVDNRIHILSEIGRGSLMTEKEVVTKSGQVVTINVRPSVKERLNAIELANKFDGTYAQQQLDMDLAREEAADLRRRLLKDVTGT